MTGPRVTPNDPSGSDVQSLDQWRQTQYLTGPGVKNSLANPTPEKTTTGPSRILSLDEYRQATAMTGQQFKGMQISAVPKLPDASGSDVTGAMSASSVAGNANAEKNAAKYSDQIKALIARGIAGAKQAANTAMIGPVPAPVLNAAADVLDKWGTLAEQNTSPDSWTGTAVRQVVAPMLHHPWMTAGMIGATALPVVGPVVAAAIGGDMASNVALYGYQRHLENQATPEARAILQADPERISGKAATIQAVMLGLGGLVHGAKGLSGAGDVSAGLMDARGMDPFVSGDMPLDARKQFAFDFLNDKGRVTSTEAAKTDQFATDLADVSRGTLSGGVDEHGTVLGRESLRGVNPATVPTKRAPLGLDPNNPFSDIPRAGVSGKSIATEGPMSEMGDVRAYEERRIAEDRADINTPQTPVLSPRRRPASVFEEPAGAKLLGETAANRGLPATASPFPPETIQAMEWQAGHAEATGEPLPLPAHPDGYSAGSDLNAPSRIPPNYKTPTTQGGVDGTQTSIPEGVTPETVEAAKNLPPSPFRDHNLNDLADEVLATHKAIEDAHEAIAHAEQKGLVGEAAQADMENRGTSYSDETHVGTVPAKYEKIIAAGKTRLAKLERELTMRGVGGEDLADVMKGAMERDAMRNEAPLSEEPLSGEPKNVAAADILNTEKLGLTSSAQDETIARDLERLKAKGLDREGVSLDQQTETAKSNIVNHLKFMLTDYDPKAAEKLSGAEIGQLYTELSNNAAQRTALLKESANPDILPERAKEIDTLVSKLQEQADNLSGNIVKGTAAKGRDLNYLRQVAQQSTDPAVWLAQAKRVLGDRPLDDETQSLIVKLAQDATEACA